MILRSPNIPVTRPCPHHLFCVPCIRQPQYLALSFLNLFPPIKQRKSLSQTQLFSIFQSLLRGLRQTLSKCLQNARQCAQLKAFTKLDKCASYTRVHHQFSMLTIKYCLLVALLMAAALADEAVIYESDPSTCTVKEEGKDLPKMPKMAVPAAPKTKQAMPADKSYLKNNPVGGNSQWIYSQDKSSSPTIFPIGTWISFTSKIYTDCPQRGAALWVSAWGWNYYVVYLNGNYIGDGWGWNGKPFELPLNCGCNDLVIYVYSYCACTAGVCFNVKQDTTGCYACKNEGVTFYNRDTCQCECVSQCGCSNAAQTWSGYPTCSCKCPDYKTCLKTQFYNRQSCSCECNKVCCAKGFYQEPYTCQCLKFNCTPGIVPCRNGFYWSHNKCDCLPIPNPDCTVTAEQVRCIDNTYFNPLSCQCEPLHPYDPVLPLKICRNAKPCGTSETLDLATCTCKKIVAP